MVRINSIKATKKKSGDRNVPAPVAVETTSSGGATEPLPSTAASTQQATPGTSACKDTIYLPYTGSTAPEWIGFKRSSECDSKRRYKAKCMYCMKVDIPGRKEPLGKHKKVCPSMPASIKKLVSVHTPVHQSDAPATGETVPEMFLKTLDLLDRSDNLLTLAFVTADVPFR